MPRAAAAAEPRTQPWNVEMLQALKANQETQFWIVLNEWEAQGIVDGYLSDALIERVKQMLDFKLTSQDEKAS